MFENVACWKYPLLYPLFVPFDNVGRERLGYPHQRPVRVVLRRDPHLLFAVPPADRLHGAGDHVRVIEKILVHGQAGGLVNACLRPLPPPGHLRTLSPRSSA
jgi:hypothetical protein